MTALNTRFAPSPLRVVPNRGLPDLRTPDVSVCIPNWNCVKHLRWCLQSLFQNPQGVPFEVIVVDNASTDDSCKMVRDEFPSVRLIENESNLGFSKASNQAGEVACGRYLFFLNNDTIVPEFALTDLVAFADSQPELGLVGPRLNDPDGSPQISVRRSPSVAALLHKTFLFRWSRLFRRANKTYRRDKFDPNKTHQAQVLMGAALLMPRSLFRTGGRWDEQFRFGVEDVELSHRVGRQKKLWYFPQVQILHFGRVGSRQNIGFSSPNLLTGYARYLRLAGVSWWKRTFYKSTLTIDAPLQMVGKGLQTIVRRVLGNREGAKKSWLSALGSWYFLKNELRRFWKA